MNKPATKKRPRSARKPEPNKAPSEQHWKGKSPTSGRPRGAWKALGSCDDDGGVGFVTVSVKLRPAEKAELKRVCTKLGITPNRAMRTMARRSVGFLEVSDKALEHLATITRQISGVSTNINQIAKAGNRTHSPDYIAFMEDRKELGAKLSELEDIIREIVNVGKRRSDGLRKLEAVVADDQGGDA